LPTLQTLAHTLSPADRTLIEDALGALRSNAHDELSAMSLERRATLINTFVRGIQGLDVERAIGLERQLLAASRSHPPASQRFALDNALALLKVRAHLRWVLVDLGLRWHPSQEILACFGALLRYAIAPTSAVDVRAERSQCAIALEISSSLREAVGEQRAHARRFSTERERPGALEFVILAR
jgi:hypothetical protein